jgi:hypothetical protein
MSVPAPNSAVDKQSLSHQIVVALPLRQDGKIWTGTVTFTASKSIEIEVEHKYNPKVIPDARHRALYAHLSLSFLEDYHDRQEA